MKDIQQSHLHYLGGGDRWAADWVFRANDSDWKTRRVGGKQGEMKAVFDDLL